MYRATCGCSYPMMYKLNTSRFFIEKHPVVLAAENKYIHTRPFKIARIVYG
jgi:hypothetical protein